MCTYIQYIRNLARHASGSHWEDHIRCFEVSVCRGLDGNTLHSSLNQPNHGGMYRRAFQRIEVPSLT